MMSRPQQVSAHPKEILNDTVDVQEPLRVVGRREAAHLTLPLSRGLMRDFGTIVRVLRRVVGDQGHDVPMGDAVATQLVGYETTRFLSLTLQEFPKESPRRPPVPTGLDKEVDQVTVLIHRAPEILALTVNRDEDFVQKPRIAESALSALQPPGVVGAELPAPLPNGFVRHDEASLGKEILDIPEAQAVSVVQPDGVADDYRRKAMPKVARSASVHPGIVPRGELT